MSEKQQTGSEEKKKSSLKDFAREWVSVFLTTFACYAFLKGTMAEARFIPSGSMQPTLQIQDRILVEKVSAKLGRPIKRGDILVFYPPVIESGIPDPQLPWAIVGAIPFYPEQPPAFVKRVVGLPGDVIEIKKGIGIFVNDKLVQEGAEIPKPDYSLKQLKDIQGYSSKGTYIQPYGDDDAPIVVPPRNLFVLGDNHNNSADSHVWGFLDQSRVIGRDCLTFFSPTWFSALSKK
jgi:signal peptidase I